MTAPPAWAVAQVTSLEASASWAISANVVRAAHQGRRARRWSSSWWDCRACHPPSCAVQVSRVSESRVLARGRSEARRASPSGALTGRAGRSRTAMRHRSPTPMPPRTPTPTLPRTPTLMPPRTPTPTPPRSRTATPPRSRTAMRSSVAGGYPSSAASVTDAHTSAARSTRRVPNQSPRASRPATVRTENTSDAVRTRRA